MTELSFEQLQQTAEAYEDRFVPRLFEGWARRLIDAADLRPDQDVLDVACGTGIVARVAVERVSPDGSVTGVDINPGMLAVAREIAPDIDWQEGAAESLPFDDETFDSVFSQFGLMFFSEPEAALREMMRVVKHDGILAVSVFDAIENQPAYARLADLYERMIDRSVGEAERGPFTMGDIDELAALFTAAGIESATIETHDGTIEFPNVREMVLADVKGWFPFAEVRLDDRTIDEIVDEAERVLEPFQLADGSIKASVPAHIVTATRA